jgi:hypothetical protein
MNFKPELSSLDKKLLTIVFCFAIVCSSTVTVTRMLAPFQPSAGISFSYDWFLCVNCGSCVNLGAGNSGHTPQTLMRNG